MISFLQYAILGVAIGSGYSLLAVPLCLVARMTGSLDLGVGAYAVLAGSGFGLAVGAQSLIIGLIGGALLGAAMGYTTIFLQSRGLSDPISLGLVGMGLLFIVGSWIQWRRTPDPIIPNVLSNAWHLGGLRVSQIGLVNIIVAALSLAAVSFVLYRTPVGRLARATASSQRNARLCGISVNSVVVVSFAAGGVLSALAGTLLVSAQGMDFNSGLALALFGFTALIVFGGATPALAYLGALALGLVETFSTGYIPSGWASAAPLIFVLVMLSLGRSGAASLSSQGDRP